MGKCTARRTFAVFASPKAEETKQRLVPGMDFAIRVGLLVGALPSAGRNPTLHWLWLLVDLQGITGTRKFLQQIEGMSYGRSVASRHKTNA